ncbi:hypothetical protein [Pandoraea sputorum]|uniref:hypothetical protein n=1 Tax=Pandoraea sputorum TaxID=93222 RepID=UPI002B2E884C|nr:hypothetical protein THI4931_04340 [Pandoraea sputorum]
MMLGNINFVIDGADRVTFKVSLSNGQQTWTYDGYATHDALRLIDKEADPLTTFEAKRPDFSLRAQDLWCQSKPPLDATFQITVDKVSGGYVVGNG